MKAKSIHFVLMSVTLGLSPMMANAQYPDGYDSSAYRAQAQANRAAAMAQMNANREAAMARVHADREAAMARVLANREAALQNYYARRGYTYSAPRERNYQYYDTRSGYGYAAEAAPAPGRKSAQAFLAKKGVRGDKSIKEFEARAERVRNEMNNIGFTGSVQKEYDAWYGKNRKATLNRGEAEAEAYWKANPITPLGTELRSAVAPGPAKRSKQRDQRENPTLAADKPAAKATATQGPSVAAQEPGTKPTTGEAPSMTSAEQITPTIPAGEEAKIIGPTDADVVQVAKEAQPQSNTASTAKVEPAPKAVEAQAPKAPEAPKVAGAPKVNEAPKAVDDNGKKVAREIPIVKGSEAEIKGPQLGGPREPAKSENAIKVGSEGESCEVEFLGKSMSEEDQDAWEILKAVNTNSTNELTECRFGKVHAHASNDTRTARTDSIARHLLTADRKALYKARTPAGDCFRKKHRQLISQLHNVRQNLREASALGLTYCKYVANEAKANGTDVEPTHAQAPAPTSARRSILRID